MSDPRPKWFITRGPGMYTALIPADELPDSVHLQGVTRIMTGDQVVGMTLVAESPPKQQFSLAPRQFSRPVQPPISESPPALLEPQNPKQFLAPDALVGNGGTTVAKSLPEAEVLSNVLKAISSPDSITVKDDLLYLSSRPLPPSGQEPDETKKVYCSYWIHNGSCDYTQQGCKYKHEMPPDQRTLRATGFRSVPRWYSEERAVNMSHKKALFISPLSSHGKSPKQSHVREISSGEAAHTPAAKSKIPAREESNVKRPRFITDDTPTVQKNMEGSAPGALQSSIAKVPPPVLRLTDGTKGSTIPESVSIKGNSIKPMQLHSIVNLIDLSESEDETSQFPEVTAGVNSSPCVVESPATILSTSSSDVEAIVESRTSPRSAAMHETPTKMARMFVPPSESRNAHRERRTTQQHISKKKSFRPSPNLTPDRGRKVYKFPATPTKVYDPAVLHTGGFASNLNQSVHAGKDRDRSALNTRSASAHTK